jgi:glucan 1,3-beta-glucosidase
MQTETPYFQANPDASQPYELGLMTNDPTFDDCALGTYCEEAFALRVISSSNILIYSAGFYSFFQDYSLTCNDDETCQEKLVETSYSQGLWIYNIFTKGAVQIVSPEGGIPPTLQSDGNQKYVLHRINHSPC